MVVSNKNKMKLKTKKGSERNWYYWEKELPFSHSKVKSVEYSSTEVAKKHKKDKTIEWVDNDSKWLIYDKIPATKGMKKYLKYERDIYSGKIPCPFTAKFISKDGSFVEKGMKKLTAAGRVK